MIRSVALACLLACLGTATAEASSERRAGVDRSAGFAFELNGAALTVRVAPGERAPQAGRQVFGKTVAAVCFSTYDFRVSGRVVREMVWPTGQSEVTFLFDRDISSKAKSCLIENDEGGDVADVRFGPRPAFLLVQTRYVGGRARPGVRAFLRLRDESGRSVLLKRGDRLSRFVEPGLYRLVRYERRCRSSCRALESPRLRCTRRLRLPERSTRVALIRVDPGRRTCRIRTASLDAL